MKGDCSANKKYLGNALQRNHCPKSGTSPGTARKETSWAEGKDYRRKGPVMFRTELLTYDLATYVVVEK